MNAKFFDLKKEKQDRMINAALKIFALNGYTHASTDDIVKEAHISKGLLFHYFESKIGVYSFLCDYSAKYYALELSSAVDPSETEYFAIVKQIEAAKLQTLKAYPYMLFFINSCLKETVPEALLENESPKLQLENALGTIYARADYAPLKANSFTDRYLKMLEYTLNGQMEDRLRDGSFNAEAVYAEGIAYIDVVSKLI
ncbi:MAG: TetR/AcrR family transcriptional regulator [Lachnospiraceae bacterium]|nr:TetR/AcrR family transcriptional regulator [Lachnospiraceae bacterium]